MILGNTPPKNYGMCVLTSQNKVNEKNHNVMDFLRAGGGRGGAQPHSIAFGGVFPNITEAILNDENSTKSQNLPPKSDHLTLKLMNFYGWPPLL